MLRTLKGYSKIVLFIMLSVLTFKCASESLLSMHQGLLRYKFLNLILLRNSDSVNSGWGPEIYI